MEIEVQRVPDFLIDEGTQPDRLFPDLPWRALTEVGERIAGQSTRTKLAYSDLGMYVVADCEDNILSSSGLPDNSDLFTEDVLEVFLWPEMSKLLYFEYEISPLGSELPLLVPNTGESFMGWLPWHYEGERRVKKHVVVRGGKPEAGASIQGWSAAIFIPFALLKGLGGVPPVQGSVWRGNVCRMDYDASPRAKWTLSPKTGGEFHDYEGFATLRFL